MRVDAKGAGLGASDVLIILAWFAISRAGAFALGVEPEPTLAEMFWQLLPFELLRDRLGESLWYLHSQPPLYNAFVGGLLKLPGDHAVWWRVAWMAVGVAFPLLICSSMRHAGAPRAAAHALALVAGLNPTLVLYENLLLYSYPEALLVLLGFWALLRSASGRPAWGQFAAAGSALVLMRAMFQPVWSLGVGVGALTGLERVGRAAVAAAVVPLIVGVLLILKNAVLFDVWTSSSWYGHNVAKLVTTAMIGETPALLRANVVSPLFATGPFAPVRYYPAHVVDRAANAAIERHGDVPALTVEAKPNGSPNFNHAVYIEVSRQLSADSLAAYRARPWLVHETVGKGLVQFHHPASLYTLLDANWKRLRPIEDWYLRLLYPGSSPALVMTATLATVASSLGIWLFGWGRFRPLRAPAGYVLVTVAWVMVTGNLAEFGENARFRFTIDPLVVTWLGVVAAAGFRFDDARLR